MITDLFNQQFLIERNFPVSKDGMTEDNYVEVGTVLGRISSPESLEKNTYQNRGMILSAVIYLDVYEYDEQRDRITEVTTGVKYNIKGLTAFRDREGIVVYLKVPVTESQNILSSGSSS